MHIRSSIIALAAVAALSGAHASNITVSTGFSPAGPQATANDYLTTVNAAVATPTAGYGSTSVSLYDGVSNHSLFGGPTTNIAFKSVIDFGVSTAGAWDFRFGVDFGGGGAVFLDGVAQDFRNTDMWWAGSYGDSSQFLAFSSNLATGNHQITLVGFEGCCDGGQQAQFRAANSNTFQTFGANDGLNVTAVPEPESYAMLLAGLGLMGTVARRRKSMR
jgi:PEP-CTERM motif